MSLFQFYENYRKKQFFNDVIFSLVKVLKGVLVLINVTLIFLRYLKNHFKLGQDVAKNVPLILCIYNKISPLDEHKKCYLGI